MPRGGYRPGAGVKPSWNYGKTKVVRIPENLVETVLQVARDLDQGKKVITVTASNTESVTESKVINLSGITIRALPNGPAVYLADLLAAGYKIYPEKILQSLKLKGSQQNQERAKSLKQEIDEAIEALNLLGD